MKTYKIEHRDVRKVAVISPDGITLKEFGYNSQRGMHGAYTKAEALISGLKAKERLNENRAIVATNRCPQCGKGIVRNLSLTGWWQCEQFGAPGFRKNGDLPACNWQCFTE